MRFSTWETVSSVLFQGTEGKDSEISCSSFLFIPVANDHSLCQAKSLSFP